MNQDLSRQLFVGIGGGDDVFLDVAEIVGIGFKIAKKTRGSIHWPLVPKNYLYPRCPYVPYSLACT